MQRLDSSMDTLPSRLMAQIQSKTVLSWKLLPSDGCLFSLKLDGGFSAIPCKWMSILGNQHLYQQSLVFLWAVLRERPVNNWAERLSYTLAPDKSSAEDCISLRETCWTCYFTVDWVSRVCLSYFTSTKMTQTFQIETVPHNKKSRISCIISISFLAG